PIASGSSSIGVAMVGVPARDETGHSDGGDQFDDLLLRPLQAQLVEHLVSDGVGHGADGDRERAPPSRPDYRAGSRDSRMRRRLVRVDAEMQRAPGGMRLLKASPAA